MYLEERALVPAGFAKQVRLCLKGYSLKDALSKQLKHSAQTEKVIYDLEAGAGNAVDVLQRRSIHEASSSSGEEVEPSTAAPEELAGSRKDTQ